MVNTRSGDAHYTETSAAAEARAARAAGNDENYFDADDSGHDPAQQQQFDHPGQDAADQGTRGTSPQPASPRQAGRGHRSQSPRPAGRGNRGRAPRRGSSASPPPPQKQPYDISEHERGEVRRMIIRNPPSAFEPTSAWFQGFYASLKLAGASSHTSRRNNTHASRQRRLRCIARGSYRTTSDSLPRRR